ncbi:glycosyltransferase [Flavisphingomonas formosensis]|uniref:glycosyltransferase n=1 Tax=Flavisphingomonas formosensis TaxID=861534 RepID=UPI0012FC86B2|nr:glycosyltransferase [Sphingomonas formosensis]
MSSAASLLVTPYDRKVRLDSFPASDIELAVVIPTLNERDNIVPLVAALDAALANINAELIFVDDWSTDGTPEVIAELARQRSDIRLLRRCGRRGLASAAIEGMLSTTAPVVALIDADMQHDEGILPEMVAAVSSGKLDVAIGSRYHSSGSCGTWSQKRLKTSRFATVLAQAAIGSDVEDPLSGFFVMRQDLIVDVAPRLKGQGFKILMDILSSAPRRLRVAEFPYVFRTRVAGRSKLSPGVAVSYLRLLVAAGLRRLLSVRLISFSIVGSIGLIVNLALLRLLLPSLGFAAAQAVAVAVAIGSNFLLNNAITYRDCRLRGWRLFTGALSFYGICGMGAFANVGVGSVVFWSDHRWWLAGAAGALVGTGWNFLVSSIFTWRRPLASAVS